MNPSPLSKPPNLLLPWPTAMPAGPGTTSTLVHKLGPNSHHKTSKQPWVPHLSRLMHAVRPRGNYVIQATGGKSRGRRSGSVSFNAWSTVSGMRKQGRRGGKKQESSPIVTCPGMNKRSDRSKDKLRLRDNSPSQDFPATAPSRMSVTPASWSAPGGGTTCLSARSG